MKSIKILKGCKIAVYILIGLFIIACITGFILLKCVNLNYYVIQSGSMQPEINIGDVVVSQNLNETEVYNSLEVGDIATYYDGQNYVTHRVYDKAFDKEHNEGLFIFKGDHNNTIDKNSVKASQVRGKMVYNLKGGSDLFGFVHSVYGIVTLVAILLMLFMIDNTLEYAIKLKTQKISHSSDNADTSHVENISDIEDATNDNTQSSD